MAEQLLTVTQLTKKLNLGKSSVYDLLRSGRLKAVRLGPRGRLRIRESDLEAFLKNLEGAYD